MQTKLRKKNRVKKATLATLPAIFAGIHTLGRLTIKANLWLGY